MCMHCVCKVVFPSKHFCTLVIGVCLKFLHCSRFAILGIPCKTKLPVIRSSELFLNLSCNKEFGNWFEPLIIRGWLRIQQLWHKARRLPLWVEQYNGAHIDKRT